MGEIASTSGTYDWLLDGGVETTAGWILGDGLDDGPDADPASLGSVQWDTNKSKCTEFFLLY